MTTLPKRHFITGLCLAALLVASPLLRAQSKAVKMAWTPSADAPQVPVAIADNLWKAKGVDVAVTAFPTGREALEALLGGQVEFAVIAEFPAATAALRKQPFSVIADLSRYKANRIITTTDVPSMAALAGKRMGTTIGTNAQYQAETALAEAGVTATIVNAGPADLLPTLQRKEVDAAAMFPAFYARAKQLLGAQYNEIFTPAYQTHFLIVASESVLKDRPADVKLFLAGLIDADAVVAKDPTSAQQAVLKATNGVIPLTAIAAGWPDYDFRVSLGNDLPTLLSLQGKWILSKGLIKSTPGAENDIGSFIKPEFLRQVSPERVSLK